MVHIRHKDIQYTVILAAPEDFFPVIIEFFQVNVCVRINPMAHIICYLARRA